MTSNSSSLNAADWNIIIEDIILQSDKDINLKEGMERIATMAASEGISIPAMCWRITLKYLAEQKARAWLKNR